MPKRKTPESEPPALDLSESYRNLRPAEFLKLVREKPVDFLRLNIAVTDVNGVVLLGFISAVPAERREIIVHGDAEDLKVFRQSFPRLLEYVKLHIQ